MCLILLNFSARAEDPLIMAATCYKYYDLHLQTEVDLIKTHLQRTRLW